MKLLSIYDKSFRFVRKGMKAGGTYGEICCYRFRNNRTFTGEER